MTSQAPRPTPTTLESETFLAAHVDGVVVVRWFRDSQGDEFDALTAFFVDAAKASGGTVDFLAIIAPVTAIPSGPLRDAMSRFAVATREIIDTTHIVMASRGGFWQPIVRSIITSLMIFVRKHGQVTVHESLDQALTQICPPRHIDRRRIEALAATAGLMESVLPPAPDARPNTRRGNSRG